MSHGGYNLSSLPLFHVSHETHISERLGLTRLIGFRNIGTKPGLVCWHASALSSIRYDSEWQSHRFDDQERSGPNYVIDDCSYYR